MHVSCVYFSVQLWPNIGLKLFLSSLLPWLGTSTRDNPCILIGAGMTNAGRRQKLMNRNTFLHLKDFALVVVHTENRNKQTYAHIVTLLHTHTRVHVFLFTFVYVCA